MRRPTALFALLLTTILSSLAHAVPQEGLPEWTPDPAAERAAVPDIYKWDLTRLFPDDGAWERSRVKLAGRIDELSVFEGKLTDARTLGECLDRYFELHDAINRLTLYAGLHRDMELGSAKYQEMSARGLAVMDELMKKAAFIRSEVLALSDEDLSRAYGEEAGPLVHRGYIDGLRRRKSRVLHRDAERVLGQMGDNLWAEIDLNEIFSASELAFQAMCNNIPWPMVHDENGKEKPLGFSSYPGFRRHPVRKVREEAVETFLATLRQYEDVFAATLGGQAAFTVNLARSRNYDTALEAYLDKDALDPAVYHTLIDTVNANLEPLHRYMSLRKRVMGVDELRLFDLYVPLVASVETSTTFAEARETVLAALQPMGEDYISTLSEGLDLTNGWIDLYPSDGKDSGAFCAGVYSLTPYVKMNFQNSIDDMSTLAHEFGHAMHHVLSASNQSYSEFRTAPFLAEIASTANEVLVQDYLLARADDDRVRAMLLNDRLESIKGTIYRQTLFAQFELAVHTFVEEGTPITAKLLDETYADLIGRYYGDDYTLGENDGLEWAYIPHLYYKYYVFTYATGLSCGIALANLVQEGPEQRDAYLRFLSGGCSVEPLDLLREAGVDLRRPDAIEAALRMFDETLAELEALLPTLR
jgi:oligoendopeptidase F